MHKFAKKTPYKPVTNYRPISTTPVFARKVERKLESTLVTKLQSNFLIAPIQQSFRTERSIETSMLLALNDTTKALDQTINADAPYFDFEAWLTGLKSLLDEGSFQVRVNEMFSEFLTVTSADCQADSQGGVFSPVLFTVCTSKIRI